MPLKLVEALLTEAPASPDSTISAEDLIAESNHRIANNLAVIAGLVRLQAVNIAKENGPFSAEDVCLLLKEVSGRIDTVSRLHRLLAEATRGRAPDLGAYLGDIAQAVVSSLSPEGHGDRLRCDTRDCSLPAHQALSVGFIVGELMTNAVKYAHPAGVEGEISLRCSQSADKTTIVEVCDNGVGLPEDFDPMTAGGLGLRLVRSLAIQLGADLVFQQTGLGLCVRLSIPPKRSAQAA